PPSGELGRRAGWAPLPLTVRDARRKAPTLKERLGAAPAHLEHTGQRGSPAVPTVQAARLVVARGRSPVLREVDLSLNAGTVTALMGRNGSGKSTLLWALQGRHRVAGGTLEVLGSAPAERTPEGRRATTGLVPQSPADLLYLETVDAECDAADADAEKGRGNCRKILDQLAPGIDGSTHPRDLSEGQRLALAVAIVLTTGPPVLLLDEPTRGLDYPAKQALAGILRDLATEPDTERTVLVATHDVEFVAQVADEVIVLADGEIVSAGPVVRAVSESPAFAPQVTKILGPGWLRVSEVATALASRSQ
ncbi:MAG: ATP-binding cassette domain-containing protein, partial [Nocardioidaceae bacterium]|nr:ATP-binding cassette domain-containing protein [Nocardioidaceae bacterium]